MPLAVQKPWPHRNQSDKVLANVCMLYTTKVYFIIFKIPSNAAASGLRASLYAYRHTYVGPDLEL